MTTFADPTFTADYQGLCSQIADVLNRQDLVSAIPNFVSLATSRIERDMVRVRHPQAIQRAQADVINGYVTLPTDFVAVQQLMLQDTMNLIEYLSPDQTKQVLSQGWPPHYPVPIVPPYSPPVGAPTYYTIIGQQIRLLPAPDAATPLGVDLWYYTKLPLPTTTSVNWVLSRYPDLYLYGALLHSAPYLKDDQRLQVWDAFYQSILNDISVEADRSVRSQTKLNAARRTF